MIEPHTGDADGSIRKAEGIEHSEPLNEVFANYVQSSAFTLSLSRNMIGALINLNDAIGKQHPKSHRLIHEGGLQALVRRGLCAVESQPRRWKCVNAKQPRWDEIASITTAGKLVLQLLAEANLAPQIMTPMPPPPPGWTDPRPRFVSDGRGGSTLTSSRRELLNDDPA